MKLFLFFIFCVFFSGELFSQNQNNTWYFGHNIGLDFNTNPPTTLNNSLMMQEEGSASISDNNGNLLFYTDGISVWNRNHILMPNGFGLLGDYSSTQSALIVPKPCDDNIYYIFTVPATSTTIPLAYSVVDMSADAGSGDVILKNVSLHVPVAEKLTATLKANGRDYWVLAKEFGTDKFLAYSLTISGLDLNPVFSNAGLATSVLFDVGYMRFSPGGLKLCLTYGETGVSQLLDFNKITGMVSNPITLSGFVHPYGVEFSPDNSKLYIMQLDSCILRQFDLSAGSAAAIQNSVTVITTFPEPKTGSGLMLGPDNKIYVSRVYDNFISIIDQPNLAGTSCNFIDTAITFTAGVCGLGLPNIINKYSTCFVCPLVLNQNVNINICPNQAYQLPSGAIVNTAGIYYDTTRNQFSCDSIITAIDLQVSPVSGFSQEDSIYAGEQYTLPSGQVVYLAGVYHSTLKNTAGCDSVITTTLSLRKPVPGCLSFKNAFTPNGDGINDYWILYNYNCFKRLNVSVYNRYGSLVYHSGDYKNDWNGTYGNKSLPDGTYYYIIKVIYLDDKEHLFKDNLTILR